MTAFKEFLKAFEAPPRSVKIKIQVNFLSSSGVGTEKVKTACHFITKITYSRDFLHDFLYTFRMFYYNASEILKFNNALDSSHLSDSMQNNILTWNLANCFTRQFLCYFCLTGFFFNCKSNVFQVWNRCTK